MINKDVNHNYYRYTDRSHKNNDNSHDYTESNIHGINKLVGDRQARCNSVVYHELVHSSLRGLD